MYIEKSLEAYIKDVGSNSSMPGGGSVAALVGSLGAALTQMVMHFTIDKKAYKELDINIQKSMVNSIKEIEILNNKLREIVDEDTEAFNSVLEAYKLPSNTDKEIEKRDIAIEKGYMKALSVPFKCFELSYNVLLKQEIFAIYGNKLLITDVAIGSILAYASMECSILNIKVNLKEMKDSEYKEKIIEDIKNSLEEASIVRDRILKIAYDKIS